MFRRNAVTLTYGAYVRREFPAAMEAVGPRGDSVAGEYLGRVHKEIARRYALLSPADKKEATRLFFLEAALEPEAAAEAAAKIRAAGPKKVRRCWLEKGTQEYKDAYKEHMREYMRKKRAAAAGVRRCWPEKGTQEYKEAINKHMQCMRDSKRKSRTEAAAAGVAAAGEGELVSADDKRGSFSRHLDFSEAAAKLKAATPP